MISAGIVLYNPEVDFLKKNIDYLKNCVDRVIIFDNTEDSEYNLKKELEAENIIYISEGKNLGIAHALNVIMEESKKIGASWCYTFDQDSKIPFNIFDEYKKYYDSNEIGILCSQFIDVRRKFIKIKDFNTPVTFVNKCITSASCTRIDVWEKVGKYDEALFIDLVDNDFSKRVYFYDYKIARVNSVILEQRFGDIEYKDSIISKFWLKVAEKTKNDNFGKLSYKKNVSPLRIYYTNRNIIYLNNKLKKYGGIGYESYNCKNYFEFFILYNFATIIRGREKKKIIEKIVQGVKDGKKMKYDYFEVKKEI